MERVLILVTLLVGMLMMGGGGAAAWGQELRSTAVEGLQFDYGRWPYPLNAAIGEELRELANAYPNLAKVHEIGRSRRGQPLWVAEITNFATGDGNEKPGMWLDGNIHAHELTGRAYLRYFVKRLLHSYGKDAQSTQMLDTRVFYLMPAFDADGGDLLLSRHPAWDGYDPQEQLGEDLDGDGYITQMRVADEGEAGEYRYYMEGRELLDPRAEPEFLQRRQRDEETGEREGADFNRNWSAEWRVAEAGAGPRPFSLPEVSAVADFILEHENVYFTYTIHSGGGSRSYMVRPPMNRPYDWMPGWDNLFYTRLGAVWGTLSRGGIMENNYYSYIFNTSRLDESGEPRGYGETMYGFADDWAYMEAGLHSLTPEINGSGWDYDGDGWIRPQEEDRWHREEKGGMFDSQWVEHEHPELGLVEIGGSRGMPPALDETLREHCEIQYDFLLYIANLSPLLQIHELIADPIGGRQFRVRAHISNSGGLPTYVTQHAINIRRDRPVVAKIDVVGGELTEGEASTSLGHLQGRIYQHQELVYDSWEYRSLVEVVEWVVKATGDGPIDVSIEVGTPKAGVSRSSITIGG